MILIVFMLIALLVVVALTVLLSAHAILRPPRMTDAKAAYVLKRLSPGDLGMAFEPKVYSVRDEHGGGMLNHSAWWIPHPSGSDRTVLFIHGYADSKVGSIAWAPTWQQLGFHILAIDLRAHGESDGTYTTAGYFERHDVEQIINQLRAERPAQTRRLVLFGVSMGAVVALAAAERRDDLMALVLDCPFAGFPQAIQAHARLFSMPLPSLLPLTLRVAEWVSGARFGQVQPLRALASLKCPVLIFQSGQDPFVPLDDARAIESAVATRNDGSEYHLAGPVSHLYALHMDPDGYRERIANFLRKLS